jgi:BirA family biotin operon repressor/biotin-[acetyl-CoA-carboxylase] ligase
MATSLVQEGFPVSRAALAAAMAEELFVLADALGGDVTAWVEEYRRQCVNLGKPVRLLWTEGQTEAVAEDIDEQFGLTVRLPDGSRQTVRTGEVSVRGLYGYV